MFICILSLFLNWFGFFCLFVCSCFLLACLLLLSFFNYLGILDVKSLSNIYTVDIFLPFCCLCIDFVNCFLDCAKLLSMTNFHFSTFAFIFHDFWVLSSVIKAFFVILTKDILFTLTFGYAFYPKFNICARCKKVWE